MPDDEHERSSPRTPPQRADHSLRFVIAALAILMAAGVALWAVSGWEDRTASRSDDANTGVVTRAAPR